MTLSGSATITATFAQINWKFSKYAIGKDAAGGANEPDVPTMPDIFKRDDGTFRMYYGATLATAASTGATSAIKSATSTDGRTWVVDSGNRLLGDGDGDSGSDGIPANEGVISGPRVIRLSNGTYRMYYQASTKGYVTPPDFRVKYATSSDGLAWTRPGSNTIIDINYGGGTADPGAGKFSLAGHCAVIRYSDTSYRIIISACYEKPANQISDLVMGTSTDGLTFSNFSSFYEKCHDPYIVKMNDGSGYRMFFGYLTERQRTAFSTDGGSWPAYSTTTQTIMYNSSGSEVTEASTEGPGDRSLLELSDGTLLLFVNWRTPSGDIALMEPSS